MRSKLVLRGLRGRLLLAFVVTSALTLAVATGVLLGPLREQLREQSTDNLEDAVLAARPGFEASWPDLPGDLFAVGNEARELRERTDARVLVANRSLTRPTPELDDPTRR